MSQNLSLYLVFWGTVKSFPREASSLYFPISHVGETCLCTSLPAVAIRSLQRWLSSVCVLESHYFLSDGWWQASFHVSIYSLRMLFTNCPFIYCSLPFCIFLSFIEFLEYSMWVLSEICFANSFSAVCLSSLLRRDLSRSSKLALCLLSWEYRCHLTWLSFHDLYSVVCREKLKIHLTVLIPVFQLIRIIFLPHSYHITDHKYSTT